MERFSLTLDFLQSSVTKTTDGAELRLVKGPVLRPDIRDRQGTTVSRSEIQQAAYNFMKRYREGDTTLGFMHKDFFDADKRFTLVECYVLDVDYTVPRTERLGVTQESGEGSITIPAGSWVMGVIVHDDAVWSLVQQGKVKGYSIGGTAKVVPDKV